MNTRKSPRASHINYDVGFFFVTVCTGDRAHHFGRISNGVLTLSPIGEFAYSQLENASKYKTNIEIPAFVVMPNHIHAMIQLYDTGSNEEMPADQRNPNPSYRPFTDYQRCVTELAKYMTSFKSVVTKFARKHVPEFYWQGRFHDHMIRGSQDGNKIYNYIETNIANWETDCFNE